MVSLCTWIRADQGRLSVFLMFRFRYSALDNIVAGPNAGFIAWIFPAMEAKVRTIRKPVAVASVTALRNTRRILFNFFRDTHSYPVVVSIMNPSHSTRCDGLPYSFGFVSAPSHRVFIVGAITLSLIFINSSLLELQAMPSSTYIMQFTPFCLRALMSSLTSFTKRYLDCFSPKGRQVN